MATLQHQGVERWDPELGRQPDTAASTPGHAALAELRLGMLDRAEGLRRALKPAGIGFLDVALPNGKRYFSEECMTVMGYGPEDRELFQRGWSPRVHPDDLPGFLENRRRALGGASDHFVEEVRRMRCDGSYGWVRFVGAVIERDPQGVARRMVATLEDVDARHRAEDQLRAAQQKIQALSAHVEAQLEDERKHIAAEVHDQCGQLLTVMKMELSDLRAATRSDHRLTERVQRLDVIADELVQMSRDLINRLRPPALDLGLVPALEWLTQEWTRQTGLTCSFSCALQDLPLPDEKATTLFRIVQESLTNVTRHAQARHVQVELTPSAGGLDLRLADDGCGFDTNADHAGHFGLLGMRERAQRVGARLELRSRPGLGTEVLVTMPLQAPVP